MGRFAIGMIAVGAAALRSAVSWPRRRLVLVTVHGHSMEPAYAHGDRVLVSKRRHCRRGDVAVFAMPDELQRAGPQWLLKRVTGVPGEPVPAELRDLVARDQVPAGFLTVRGDAPRSLDSGQLGFVPQASVLGVVIYPVRRAERIGPVSSPAQGLGSDAGGG